MEDVQEFREYRAKMNEQVLSSNNRVIKRIFSLDAMAFEDGALDRQTKELIGLACSLVLRCDDCVKYHLEQCIKAGLAKEKIIEAMSISNLIGGTIVIPHLRRAYDYLHALEVEANGDSPSK